MKVIKDDFLLGNKTAESLFHDYAEDMPVFDFHCHLPPEDIASDRTYKNMTEIWLGGDHYKWRAMRANGIDEKLITGNADDFEKFQAWVKTLNAAVRNPLYHWTYLELSRYFGIDEELLTPETAGNIYRGCNELLKTKDFSARNLLLRMNVKAVCTTDDPADSLEHHKKIKESLFAVRVLPTFRPDRAMEIENTDMFNSWTDRLEAASNIEIRDYRSFLEALRKRHAFFHEMGCRSSDHGMEIVIADDFTDSGIRSIFRRVRNSPQGGSARLSEDDIRSFKSAVLAELAEMDYERDWVMQLHIGALRDNNKRMLGTAGRNTGFDSIGDAAYARPLSRLMDRLDAKGRLPKTILFNINPKDNEMLGSMAGNFQDGSVPGKIQFGPAWWFLDNKDGIVRQLNSLSCMGLLSRFVGMLTDSRSFLSFPRHEYFRRILCGLVGNDMENGEIFEDTAAMGKMIRNICFGNAVDYFGVKPLIE
ncbi:MAG: glucuronate isomerase [Brevinematales bacterium]